MLCRTKRCRKEIPDNAVYCPYCGIKQVSTPRKTIKRENGTGSVYKRSDLKERPWVAATPKTRTAASQIIGHYATAQEAKDALDDYRRNPTTKLNITVEELHDEWEPLGYKDKSKQLCACYDAAWKHLEPIYAVKFRELRTAQMQRIVDHLQTERPKLDEDGNPVLKDNEPQILKPMSFSSLSKIKILLGLLYQYAMENDIVHKNYSEFLVLPKKGAPTKECFTDIELKKIEESSGAVPFADCILFMCYTGLRITEFLTLTRTSIRENEGAYSLYGGIKTEAGKNRVIPVHEKVAPILKEWMGKNGETVFCRKDGTPYPVKYFRDKCYKPALDKLGVRALTPHATRRTFSTRLSAAGVRPEDLIALMGHTDYSVDVESYINQQSETLQKAIEKLS